MHQSGHEHTLCYSTNNLYVPRCLILRVNFRRKKNPSLLRYCLCGALRDVQWRFLASFIFKTQTPCFESWSRVTLPQQTSACTWICAKSVLPVAVMRFQWSANRRVKFSNFIGLPTQGIWFAFGVSWPVRPLPCVLGPRTREAVKSDPSDFWRHGQSLSAAAHHCFFLFIQHSTWSDSPRVQTHAVLLPGLVRAVHHGKYCRTSRKCLFCGWCCC